MKCNRDDFPARIRHQIEKKSAYRCSNPSCCKVLIGPSEDFTRVVSMGIVSHICAAAPKGPRYDPSMTPSERSSEENGLLLCRYCAALVDADDVSYPPELPRLWKKKAYERAREELGKRAASADDTACLLVVKELVRTCLCSCKTQGTVSKNARFRSYAGTLYRLFFEELPQQADYDTQLTAWTNAIDEILFDAPEPVHCRRSHHNRSFPSCYRYLMRELQTYDFQPQHKKAMLLDAIEATVRELFLSQEAFGLRDNNGRENL